MAEVKKHPRRVRDIEFGEVQLRFPHSALHVCLPVTGRSFRGMSQSSVWTTYYEPRVLYLNHKKIEHGFETLVTEMV